MSEPRASTASNANSPLKVLAICGSLQARSGNLTLLQCAARSAPQGVALTIYQGLGLLPHFNPELDCEPAPESVRALRAAVAESDALLIAMPEYGHSLPGSLKNAIDWLIGSGELEGKLIAITSAVPAPERGRLGLKALRDTLAAVSARVPFQEPISKGPNFERDVAQLLAVLIRASNEAAPVTLRAP